MKTTAPTTDARLRRGLLCAFTLPSLVLGLMHGPEGQIQAIYAKHGAVALTALATAMLLSKIFDAVTYPLIGVLSDRTFASRGSRKSWIVAGTLVSMLGFWMLMRPPVVVGAVYFGVWMAVTYLGWKLMEIPLQAWSYGLSADHAQRTRVQTWRALSQFAGQLLFFVVPFLSVAIGVSQHSELDFKSLGVSAIICAVALPLATLAAVARVPNGSAPLPPAPAKRLGLREVFGAIRHNQPLLLLMAAFLPVNLLGGMSGGVIYLYVDTYLGLSEPFPAIMLLAMLASLAGIPFWNALAARFESHRVWAASLAIGGCAAAALALLRPGPLALALAFVIYPTLVFCLSGFVIVYSMSADIVDHGRQVTGEDHAGLYGALFAFLQKSLTGVGAAAGLALVGCFGFDATAASQTDRAIIGIKITAAVLPAIALFIAAILIRHYPLTRARVAEIQAQLRRA